MRKFLNSLSFGGLFVIVISLIGFWGTTSRKNIKEDGFIVEVKVLNPPSSCEDIPSKGLRLELEYKNKVFIEWINQKQCSEIMGQQTIQMLSNEKESEFHFFDDYKEIDYIYSAIILVFGIFVVFKGASEKEKKKK